MCSDNTNNRHIDSANSQWQISTPAATFTLQCETGNGTLEDCNTVCVCVCMCVCMCVCICVCTHVSSCVSKSAFDRNGGEEGEGVGGILCLF